jgi:hypothetical protein
MRAFLLLPAMLALAAAKPGGHIGYGGVYPVLDQNADYIPHAKSAAKLAAQIAFEEDESLLGIDANRPARWVDTLSSKIKKGPLIKARISLVTSPRYFRRASVYVPTFFTSEPQPNVADGSQTLPQLQRINRQTQQVQLPLYYNAYRAPNQQIIYQ